MKTSNGVIQGYDGVAVVDGKHQIVVGAEAFGEGQEHGLLVPMLEQTREAFRELGRDEDVLAGTGVTADAGFHTEHNLKHLEATGSMAMWPTRYSGSAIRALRRPSGTSRSASPIRIGCSGPRTSTSTRQRTAASVRQASGSTATARMW